MTDKQKNLQARKLLDHAETRRELLAIIMQKLGGDLHGVMIHDVLYDWFGKCSKTHLEIAISDLKERRKILIPYKSGMPRDQLIDAINDLESLVEKQNEALESVVDKWKAGKE